MTRDVGSARYGIDAAASLVFAAAILAPSFDWIASGIPGPRRMAEERRSAPWPRTANWRRFPGEFEAWFQDAMGLREALLTARSRCLVRGLGVSPTDEAVLGEDDWLFVTERRLLDVGRGARPLTGSELEAWRRSLEGRRDACAELGARYLFVIAPEKGTVYPEKLPSEYAPIGPSRTDQWLAHLRAHSTVEVLDLRPALCAERARDAGHDLAYFPFGPHWTERGAEAAARVLVERLASSLPGVHRPPTIPEEWRGTEGRGDDWAPRLYLDSLGPQVELVAGHAPRSDARIVASFGAGDFSVVYESEAREAPRLLLVHDSFGQYARKFLVGSFSRSACIWDAELRPGMLESNSADVVVEFFVERVLTTRPSSWSTGHLHDRFAQSTRVAYSFDAARGDPRPAVETAKRVEILEGALSVLGGAAPTRVVLPPFTIPDDSIPLLRIDLESDRSGTLLVSYTTDRETTLTRQNSFHYTIGAGSNQIYAEIAGERIRGSLVLVLPSGERSFRIRTIEARLVER